MTARIIDGKAFAERLRGRLERQVAVLKQRHGITPGLAAVLVGDDPASLIYVRNKERQIAEIGMHSAGRQLAADTPQADLLALVAGLNRDPAVNGILIQLPLPGRLDSEALIDAVDPAKDVDGFHPLNVGLLASTRAAMVPCTPRGCMMLLTDTLGEIGGMTAVVVGRSNIVGKPLARLLLAADCTVTVAHSKTRELAALCRGADILIAAVGRAGMIRGDWIKPGAAVIDVGISRIDGKLLGDVEFDAVKERAGLITPVPGGVGPLTITMLLSNTLQAFETQLPSRAA